MSAAGIMIAPGGACGWWGIGGAPMGASGTVGGGMAIGGGGIAPLATPGWPA